MEDLIKREIEPLSNPSGDPHRHRATFTTFKNHIVGIGLENCNLSYFPEIISKFEFLTYLSLACNNIEKLPESISNLINLISLNLYRNKIEKLSNITPEICYLISLDLSQNLIKRIPESIFGLKSLKILRLSYNKLERLSKSIANLKFLEHLLIDGNNLKSLPTSLFEMGSLKLLSISPAHLDKETINRLKTIMKNFKEYIQSNIPLDDQNHIVRYIHRVPKLYIITPPYYINFSYEYGSEMFWSSNNTTLKFGSPIDPFLLPISSEDAQKLKDLSYLWGEIEIRNRFKKKNGIDYDSQYSDWERLRRETGELLIKVSKELGPDFIFSGDFDYYVDSRNKMQELDSDISNTRVKTLMDEALSTDDDFILLHIFKKGILKYFNEKELLEYQISLKLHGKFNFADILVSEYLNNYSSKRAT